MVVIYIAVQLVIPFFHHDIENDAPRMNPYLAQGQNPLLWSNATSLDHNKVLFDHSVVGESSHRVDALVGGIVLGGGVVLDELKKIKKSVRNCRPAILLCL